MAPANPDGADPALDGIRWLDDSGQPVACVEKLRVLAETLGELRQAAQDALEDAVLMGCAEAQVRAVLNAIVAGLENPYRKGQ